MRSHVIPGLLAAIFIAGAAVAQSLVPSHGPPAAARSILAAEKAFAARSVTAGSAAAFADFVDPVDGREFVGAGDPISGPAAILAAHKGETGVLAWTPAEVFAAKAGDMGLTWGRWTYTPREAAAKLSTGRYVTVWRKNAKGAWKAIIDMGNPDPS